MGAPIGENGSDDSERPQHQVHVASFEMGKFLVTFADWDHALAQGAPLHRPHDETWGRGSQPVIDVNWRDAHSYIDWLNTELGLSGRPDAYRLPTEAEWEYACRAGTVGSTFFAEPRRLDDHAWHAGNSEGRTHPVGQKLPNPWGLHDMLGNVWEWCADVWRNTYDEELDQADSKRELFRVVRGGSCLDSLEAIRSACRTARQGYSWTMFIKGPGAHMYRQRRIESGTWSAEEKRRFWPQSPGRRPILGFRLARTPRLDHAG